MADPWQLRHDLNAVMFALTDLAKELDELHPARQRRRRNWAVHVDTSLAHPSGQFRVPHMASPDCGCWASKEERDTWYAEQQAKRNNLEA